MPLYICHECGYEVESEEIPEGWCESDGEYYCEDCSSYCDYCDERYPNNELRTVYEDTQICEDCYQNRSWMRCIHCGHEVICDEVNEVVIQDGNNRRTEYWCEDCCQREADMDSTPYLVRADENGDIYQPNLNNNIQREILDCPDCRESQDGVCSRHLRMKAKLQDEEETTLWVYDTNYRNYHASEHRKFKSTKLRFPHEHPYLYYGIELEILFSMVVDKRKVVREFIKATNGLFVSEYDSSVDNLGCGIELISRPLSYKKWMSNEIKDLLKKGIKVLEKYHAMPEQPDGCGFHVHLSRRFFEQNTRKSVKDIKSDMDWIIQYYQPEIELISRRQFTRYCASKAHRLRETLKHSSTSFNLKGKVSLEKGDMTVSLGGGDSHHDAIIQSGNTIEIRTFKSTIKLNEILYTIEFCRAISHAARNMNLKKKTFRDIIFCKDSYYLPELIESNQHLKIALDKEFKDKLEVRINGKF